MAQTAAEPAGERAVRKAKGSARAARAADQPKTIALDLAPLAAPFRKRGRLAIRVENMPPLARLSAGRNNGDNSWSLASDELEDLTYQPPATFTEPHTLAIRIVVHEFAGASTAAVLDYAIPAEGAAPPPALHSPDSGESEALQRLRAQLADTERQLAEREAALAEAQEDSEALRVEFALARDSWQAELEARETEAEADAARRAEQARNDAARKAEAALAQSEARWKAEEAARLAAARAQWQDEADGARAAGEGEVRRLNDDLAGLREALRARESELAQLRAARTEDAREAARAQAEALRDAERTWRAEEAERQAAAKAQAQRETEAAVAAARAAGGTSDSAVKDELARLRAELATMGTRLAGREAELAQLTAARAQDDAHREGAQRAALAEAEARGKAQAADALRELQARCEEAEAALAEAKAGGDAPSAEAPSAEALEELRTRCAQAEAALQARDTQSAADKAEIDRLRGEWSALEDALAQRDGELEQLRAAVAEPKTPPAAQDTQDAEAMGAALAEATARYEAAETALIELRKRGTPARVAEFARLQDEVNTLQTMLTQREIELSRLRTAADRWYEHEAATAGYSASQTVRKGQNDNEAPGGRGILRDIAVVMAVAAAAVLFYPRIVASLPYAWQAQLPAFMTDGGYASDPAPPADTPPSPPPAPEAAAPDRSAVITDGVNLRAEPSGKASIRTTLKAGTEVAILDVQKHWTHIRLAAAKGAEPALTGWVYNSYVKATAQRTGAAPGD